MPSRRTFGLAVATALASCVGASPGGQSSESPATGSPESSRTSDGPATPTPSDTPEGMWNLGHFVLWNQHDAEHDLTLRVEREGDVLLDETRTLSAGDSTRVDNPTAEPGSYRVAASISSGESATYEWTLECQGEAEYLRVLVTDAGDVDIEQTNTTVAPQPPC